MIGVFDRGKINEPHIFDTIADKNPLYDHVTNFDRAWFGHFFKKNIEENRPGRIFNISSRHELKKLTSSKFFPSSGKWKPNKTNSIALYKVCEPLLNVILCAKNQNSLALRVGIQACKNAFPVKPRFHTENAKKPRSFYEYHQTQT